MGIFKGKMMAAALCVLLASGTAAPAAFAQESRPGGSNLQAAGLVAEAAGANMTMATAQEIALGELVAGELTYTKDGARTYWDSYWYKFRTGGSDIAYNFLFESVADNYVDAYIYDSNGAKVKKMVTKNTPTSYLAKSFEKNAWYYVQVLSSIGTSGDKDLGYHLTVSAKENNISKAEVKLDGTAFTYDGRSKRPGVTVTLGGETLGNSDYTVSYANNTNPGTATVIVTGKGDYVGTKSTPFTIKKAGNTLKASGKKVTLKSGAKKLKKSKSVTKSKAFAVSNAKGSVKFSKKSGNKKITVSKAGKVTVKKGLKNGSYKVKVNVEAAGNAYYSKLTKTVTLTVRVKK